MRTGIDIVRIQRIREAIEKQGGRFLGRIFTDKERAYCDAKADPSLSYAARFAAKEAFIKAVNGTKNLFSYNDVEILNEVSGAPVISLPEAMKEQFDVQTASVSLAHEQEYAVAMVVVT